MFRASSSDRGHEKTPSRDAVHRGFRHEPGEGFAQRRAADPELVGKSDLADPLAGGQTAVD